MSVFVEAVEALAEASRELDTPVISGNVSFYNETSDGNVTSTPSPGMVGLRESIAGIPASHFVKAGDEILLWRLPGVSYVSDMRGEVKAFTGELDPEGLERWFDEVRAVSG